MTGAAISSAPGRGNLVVLSAPSGTGKTTLAVALLRTVPGLSRSVSHTTRPRREQERDGVDYHFVSRSRFQEMAEADLFLEWAEIYGHLYGTGREATTAALEQGLDVLLVIDVQGARWVRRRQPDALFMFLMPPGHDALLSRLSRRGTESSGSEAERLRVAREEIRAWTEYDYLIVNDDLEETREAASAVIRADRQRRMRMAPVARAIAATFPAP